MRQDVVAHGAEDFGPVDEPGRQGGNIADRRGTGHQPRQRKCLPGLVARRARGPAPLAHLQNADHRRAGRPTPAAEPTIVQARPASMARPYEADANSTTLLS